MTSSNAKSWIEKYILLNNLSRKYSLLMKFGQFVQFYKRKVFLKKFYKIMNWKLVQDPFLFLKNPL